MIKINQLKKQLLRNGAIVLGALAATGGFMAWGIMSTSGLEARRDQLKQQSQIEISEAQKQQQEYEATIAAFDRYSHIPKQRFPANDYDSVQSRIRAVRPIIEIMQERYKFSNLDVKISKLDDPVPADNGAPYVLIKSDLTIKFTGLTDEFVYSFVQALINELPGYLYLQELSINRTAKITPELLQQISASGTAMPLVDGAMTLVWKTIKSTAAADATTPAPVTP